MAAPFLSAPVGRSTDRVGARLLTAASMALAALALVAIALLADQREVLVLLPAFLAFGIARPVETVAPTVGTVAAIPRADRALSTALVTESRQLGAVMGVAILGLVLTVIANDVPGGKGGALKATDAATFISGFRAATLVSAGLAAAASVLSWLWLRPVADTAQEPVDVAVPVH